MKLTAELEKEIKTDIERCKQQTDRIGSMKLYQNLVAKYVVLDSHFENGLSSTIGKAVAVGQELDYRPELVSVANKLHMWLVLYGGEKTQNPTQIKIRELIKCGETIGKEEYHPVKEGFPFSYVSGPKYDEWMAEINIINERYLKTHPSYDSLHTAYKQRDNNPDSYESAMAQLKVVAADDEFWSSLNEQKGKVMENMNGKNKVFIVHGHDETAKQTVARFLEKCRFEAIILHEQPDGGSTIIEKIEKYTDVVFAIILYTPCDIGRAKKEKKGKARARQNVVFEHGYLIGKLSRERVCALVKDGVEIPGDMSGVVYKVMDDAGAWKAEVLKEMKNAGISVDANKLL